MKPAIRENGRLFHFPPISQKELWGVFVDIATGGKYIYVKIGL